MATLKEYYNKDFSMYLSAQAEWPMIIKEIELFKATVKVHLDFVTNTKFISFYVPFFSSATNVVKTLVKKTDEALVISEKISINTRAPGDGIMFSEDLVFSGRVYFYSEGKINNIEFEKLKQEYKKKGLYIHYRDMEYVNERVKNEKPLAFISHDTRDKEEIASKIAFGLEKRMCPVWYDEYSLKVGDSLRESIEKGLKECKKCILILSPNFIKNTGWTKTEFNSIFTREIMEKKNIILPVWCGISKEELYEYSPILVDRVGLNIDKGIENTINDLYKAII